MTIKQYLSSAFLILSLGVATAQQPSESDYYTMITLPVPEGIVLEVGGLTTLPDGSIAAATRRGDVWVIENPGMEGGSTPNYRLFATGLHEALGLAWHDGTLWVTQRGALTRLWDKDGDGKADLYEEVYSWPISGHYHEYSYGPAFAPDGNMFVSGNVAFGNIEWWRGESRVPWRGWIMRITPDGTMEPWATGMRSPCGLAVIDGDLFYADNQGDWIGSGGLVHVEKGDFTGHPAGLKWAERPESPVKVTLTDIYSRVNPRMAAPGQRPIKPENIEDEVPQTLFEIAEEVEGVKTPAVWLPHGVLGISTSQIIKDETGGAFGPFAGQILIGDQGQSKITRVFLEKVNGVYQGAAFPFRENFQSGILRLSWGPDGSLFVGESNRGWGSAGPQNEGLQRLVWTGKMPFEMKAIRATADGFEIEFTQPVDKKTAGNPASYEISGFIYKYHPAYGSPAVNVEGCAVRHVVVAEDGLSARLVVDNLRQHYVHEVKAAGITSYRDGAALLHSTGYYTLNEIPAGDKLMVPAGASATMPHQHTTMPQHKTSTNADQAMAKPSPTPAQVLGENLAKRQLTAPESWTEGADINVRIGTVPGLQYSVKDMTVKAGSKIRWTFSNQDDMPHNCLIVMPNAADAVGEAAMALGVQGMSLQYVPNNSKVLYHTKLLQPGTSETIYFVAPDQPGVYQYVCTYPGHYTVMRGLLRVVK
ncbi:MAG: plastocyanin/azurin family copper-binding protein [Bacteroidia bacterium]|nr:plastocyanin/azurin family copper-binding protein [Bacteroidia bacterium]